MTVQWLLQWWNLIFVLPALLALLYMGLCVLTGLGMHESDADISADADADLDADADIHADVDGDTDVSADADADADHDVDVSHEATVSASTAILGWLGAGKVPLTLLASVLLLSWGFIGFAANAVLRPPYEPGWKQASAFPMSIPLAVFGALLATSGLSRIMARYVPLRETSARRRHELLGLVGEAILPIGAEFGMAAVRDQGGEPYQVACCVDAGAPEIEKGARVRLIGYNARQRMFLVVPEPRPKQ